MDDFPTFMQYAGTPEAVKFSKMLCLFVWGCLLMQYLGRPKW